MVASSSGSGGSLAERTRTTRASLQKAWKCCRHCNVTVRRDSGGYGCRFVRPTAPYLTTDETYPRRETVRAPAWLIAGSLIVFATALLRAGTGSTPLAAPDRPADV